MLKSNKFGQNIKNRRKKKILSKSIPSILNCINYYLAKALIKY